MVTEAETKRMIAVAFRGYDILGELLPEVDEFIQDFRVLHAQLREGDRLEIRVETRSDPEDARFGRVPALTAYFVPKGGKERKVLKHGTWEGGGYPRETLLYND